ncbi:Rad4-domain-containing protein [Delitschia confertaspora ATCC 74209]|uniref:Rad4-domain-containing protein n=1 Tax=Delitschia confertaspora ATCC 74209 TaxID=1513339 RepID=A0A9P4MRZ8_9PLEO|nr:Rad4-domain-containing protein [Delitschia confertaspora ATCC 74209]
MDIDNEAAGRSPRMLQTVTDDSEVSDESDLEWEDALQQNEGEGEQQQNKEEPVISDVSITIGGDEGTKTTQRPRRKGITSVEKKLRLDIHKLHVLCLLYHVHRRNTWCNDETVQSTLRRLPSPKALNNLVPNPEFTQIQATTRFVDGIKELKQLWANRFTVNALGMHKPRWADADAEVQPVSDFDQLDDPMDRKDFRTAAHTLRGSQDVGAQLFCALLRGIGVEARLVCSLQCLPFNAAAQTLSPQASKSTARSAIVLDPYNNTQSLSPSKAKAISTPSRPKRMSRLERALGVRGVGFSAGVPPKPKKKYHTPYPVYWVEAFNPAAQKWIAIDPLSTSTVDRPEKLEPPLSYSQSSLVYAVGFEDDSTAKDVTRRYAKAYNAKTRKFRVESTPDGAKWWKRALKVFRRHAITDRDQVEDAALARKEASEGLPKNVQDFKGHPVYVLERHLRHNEVIHPKNQVGKVNLGTALNPKMEPIYRRRDVHIVHSADKWYRLGRDIKEGEQPLRHAKPRKSVRRSLSPDMGAGDGEKAGVGLYAFFQTELYVPPPVVRGRVPRNVYGNLDLYVPSMVPPGGVHIPHKNASKAARIIGVDYADAVTGFNFKGRHGTAVIQGVVVAEEYGEAMKAVLDAMEYAQEEEEIAHKSLEALRLWRRFLLGLRIYQRINAIEIDGEKGDVMQMEIDQADKKVVEQQQAGGFFPDAGSMEPAAPLGATRRLARTYEPEFAGGFQPDEAVGINEGGGFVPDEEPGGGFIPEDTEGGGFISSAVHADFGSSLLKNHKLSIREDEENMSTGAGFIQDSVPVPQAFIHDDTADGGFITEDAQDSGRFIPEEYTGKEIAAETYAFNDSATSAAAHAPATEIPKDGAPGSSPTPSKSDEETSDAGSLPLEDPDDEDADPEWLVDVT